MARTTVRDLENVILSMQQRVHEQGAKIQQLEAQVARLAVVAQSQVGRAAQSQQQQGSPEALAHLQQLMEENEGYTQGCYIPEAYAEMNISRQRRIYRAVADKIQVNAS